MTELHGRDFIALRRLSDRDDNTLADVGQTCERVPAKDLPALLGNGTKIKLAPKPKGKE